jgi:hypothetical protein
MRTRIHMQCAGLALILFGSVVTRAAGQTYPLRFENVRSWETDMRLAMTTCYQQSATCRRLIETIESSTTIVYVNTGRCRRRPLPSSCLTFMAEADGYRFLRVSLDPALRGDTVIKILAHELQHAVEIVRAPQVIDTHTMRALYERIGYPLDPYGNRADWETVDAQRVGELVSRELKQARKALLQARR